MTTADIAKAQIYLIGKDGKILVGCTTDQFLLQIIASYVRFIGLDESKVARIPIKEIVKQDQEAKEDEA